MLSTFEELPKGFLETPSQEMHRVLPGPTLIHLPGRRQEPVFTSVLLHGNEDTGLTAVQKLLKKYQRDGLPRSLSVFVGNVQAARFRKRRLEGQPDYNRIWTDGKSPEHEMMRRIFQEMKERRVFASIDIHNNTGFNPHYACVNRLDHRFFQLALLFSRTVVYFIRPQGVQTMAFAELCPSVTVECGHVGDPAGIQHALEFLESTLHLSEVPHHPVSPHDMGLFHTVALVKLPKGADFGFGKEDAEIRFIPNLDRLNFNELAPHTQIGWIRPESFLRLEVSNEEGKDVSEHYFLYEGAEIRTRVPLMPSMFTLDKEIIRQDVLGYLMERMEIP